MLPKNATKSLLRVCKEFIKLNYYLKSYNISQPAISRFINSDNYDEFISDQKLNKLCDEIYSSCLLYCDIYEEIKRNVA